MKVLLVTFLVAIVALVAIALPHHHHNGTSHHHPPGGQWNGTDAAGSAGQFNRTFPGVFRPPRWGGPFGPRRNISRPVQPPQQPFDFEPEPVFQVPDQRQDVVA
uniref:Putative hhh secreted protein n=1 Tax=Psorophora albipes TaxID=869069 RepID=T1DFP5_9DIPT